MQSSEDFGSTFGRAWQLLTGNWILLVPGIVIAIVAGVLVGVLAMTGFGAVTLLGGAGVGLALLSGLVALVIGLIAAILTLAYTTGMASAAWRTGTATLADGSAAFSKDGAPIMVAMLLLIALGIVAAILSPFTLFLSMLAFFFLFIYTFPSIIVGGHSGTEALGESARLAIKNFPVTLGIIVLLGIASWCGVIVGALFHGVPLLGPIVRLVIQQIVAVYATLVIVGEYIKLRSTVETVGVGSPPSAPPPSPS